MKRRSKTISSKMKQLRQQTAFMRRALKGRANGKNTRTNKKRKKGSTETGTEVIERSGLIDRAITESDTENVEAEEATT